MIMMMIINFYFYEIITILAIYKFRFVLIQKYSKFLVIINIINIFCF
jgi:hypothetical protein